MAGSWLQAEHAGWSPTRYGLSRCWRPDRGRTSVTCSWRPIWACHPRRALAGNGL